MHYRKSALCIIILIVANAAGGASSFLFDPGRSSSYYPSARITSSRQQTPSSTHHQSALCAAVDASSASDITDERPRHRVPPGILGPPDPLRSLQVGQFVNAFRSVQVQPEGVGNGEVERREFTIERVSSVPDAFCLRNFVSPSECERIRAAAEATGMERAGTVTMEVDTSSRKNCSVAWLQPSSDGDDVSLVVGDLASSTANIFLSREVFSHPSAGGEDLQVLRYGAGGEFIHHHDGEPRILTVIYYINGVGGTWFPLACTSEDDADNQGEKSKAAPGNKAQALEMVKDHLQPGKDGLLVKGAQNDGIDGAESEHVARVNRGDAIAFYGYKDDGSGELDWRSIHCGLPTTEEDGTKWIANHWFRLNSLVQA